MARNSNVLVGGAFAKDRARKPEEAVEGAFVAEGGELGWDSLDDFEKARIIENVRRAQKALEADVARRGASVMGAPDKQLASLYLQALAEFVADHPDQAVEVGSHREAALDNLDPTWITAVPAAWLKGVFAKHAWASPPSQPDVLPDHARVVILGDWGSGLYGAPPIAAAVGADPRPVDLLVHLGDVYYAGTERAIRDRFLAFWPRRPEAINRACNSNHEMYPGGHAYFDLTLTTFRQRSSAFALRNEHWLVVGLDTAYVEGDLAEDQAAWLDELLGTWKDQKVILLSHHQAFTLYDKPAKKALKKLDAVLRSGRVDAWYWGHEHRCVLFDQDPDWKLWGRCVGHSGFPEFRRKQYHAKGDPIATTRDDQVWLPVPARNGAPAGLVLDGPNPHVADDPPKYVPHGYMTIELDGPELIERVHDTSGAVIAVARRGADGRTTVGTP